MEKNTIRSRLIYWTLCTFLIVAIFCLVFGVVAVLFENDVEVKSSIGLIIGSVGSIIVILALYKPLSLTSPAVLESKQDHDDNKKAISVWYAVIGFSLLIGGVVFSLTESVGLLIFFLILPYISILALKAFLYSRKD